MIPNLTILRKFWFSGISSQKVTGQTWPKVSHGIGKKGPLAPNGHLGRNFCGVINQYLNIIHVLQQLRVIVVEKYILRSYFILKNNFTLKNLHIPRPPCPPCAQMGTLRVLSLLLLIYNNTFYISYSNQELFSWKIQS